MTEYLCTGRAVFKSAGEKQSVRLEESARGERADKKNEEENREEGGKEVEETSVKGETERERERKSEKEKREKEAAVPLAKFTSNRS